MQLYHITSTIAFNIIMPIIDTVRYRMVIKTIITVSMTITIAGRWVILSSVVLLNFHNLLNKQILSFSFFFEIHVRKYQTGKTCSLLLVSK